MKITDFGYIARGVPETSRACITFGTILPLSDGSILATGRAGDDKDSDLELIEFYRSNDGGQTWGAPETPFKNVIIDGQFGTLKICYLTEISAHHIIAAAMWVDRTAHPGKPLFNAETEGCLPMAILLADSYDGGASWTEFRKLETPIALGPPSLTNPIVNLGDGRLAISIETNKQYDDVSQWHQKAVFLHSDDNGQSWSEPVTVAEDPLARIFNWDLRCGSSPDGRIATFAWTYDTKTQTYLNIHRRISSDGGQTWSKAQDLGFADQAGPPAMLSDGRVVLAFVDRFGDGSIHLRLAPTIDAPFDPASDLVIYNHQQPNAENTDNMGNLLVGMELWGFGLPFATELLSGKVMVTYYAGDAKSMSLHFALVSL